MDPGKSDWIGKLEKRNNYYAFILPGASIQRSNAERWTCFMDCIKLCYQQNAFNNTNNNHGIKAINFTFEIWNEEGVPENA